MGLCIKSIADSTLLTFCPPEPEARAVLTVMSSGRITTSTSSTSGITATRSSGGSVSVSVSRGSSSVEVGVWC